MHFAFPARCGPHFSLTGFPPQQFILQKQKEATETEIAKYK